MFQKGEFIIYGNKGVCEVTDISKIAISGASRDRLYYVLQPAQDKEGRIFTPKCAES